MLTSIIFSFGFVAMAGRLLYNNKKTKATFGTNMFQGKVKTKSNVKLLFVAFLALVVIIGVLDAVQSGFNDVNIINMGTIFFICCFIYTEHNNFIISRSGVMYNSLAVSWDSVESYEWDDNKLRIRIPSRFTSGVVTVDNRQKKDIDRVLKKYIKKVEKNN